MRDLQECQAEVFRRSEKRIKARKQRRNRILLTCIPLVLCVFAFPLLGLSGLRAMDSAPQENAMEMEMLADGTTCVLTAVRISGNTVTAPEALRQFETLLGELSPNKHSANGSGDTAASENQEDYEVGQIPEQKGYAFVTVSSTGEQTQYYLAGNTLENRTENWTSILTPAQAEALTALLTG